MSRFRLLAFAFSLTAVLTVSRAAAADPVQIEGGHLVLTGVQDVMSRGFMRHIGYNFVTDEFRIDWVDVDFVVQNPASPTFQRPTNWTSPDGSTMLAFVDFASVSVLATPSLTPTPFSLNGSFRIVDESGAILFNDTLFGFGTASWQFIAGPSGGDILSGVRYEFSDVAPTPEPTTLFLLGSGLAGVMLRRRLHS